MQRIALLALLLWSAPAHADGRKVDFTVAILDQDNEPITECADPEPGTVCKTKRTVTLGTIAMRALTAPEQNLPQEESLKRGQLAISVYRSAGAELTEEEVVLLKKQIAKGFGPLIVVRTFPLLFSK